LVQRLGTPALRDRGIPGKRGPSCHYNAGGIDVFLEADLNGVLVGWKKSC
jgi:hypothetical protein